MAAYIIRRLLLVIPTLLGIMIINFAVVQIVPGGPVEQMIAQMTGTAVESTARFSGSNDGENLNSFNSSETSFTNFFTINESSICYDSNKKKIKSQQTETNHIIILL